MCMQTPAKYRWHIFFSVSMSMSDVQCPVDNVHPKKIDTPWPWPWPWPWPANGYPPIAVDVYMGCVCAYTKESLTWIRSTSALRFRVIFRNACMFAYRGDIYLRRFSAFCAWWFIFRWKCHLIKETLSVIDSLPKIGPKSRKRTHL